MICCMKSKVPGNIFKVFAISIKSFIISAFFAFAAVSFNRYLGVQSALKQPVDMFAADINYCT